MPFGVYSGVTPAIRLSLPVLTGLYNEAESVLAYAAANPNTALREKWFGTRNAQATILNKLATLATYATTQPIDIESRNWKSLAMSDMNDPAPVILIGSWFSLSWFNTGERVQTLIHELAHKALGAVDEKLGDEHCYKHKALELARDPSRYARAMTNAENWGYFVANHRFLMPGPPPAPARNDPDWSSIVASNVDAKGQPVTLAQDPTLIDPVNPTW